MERDASRRLSLAMAVKNDIVGWTQQLRDRKIDQPASVIVVNQLVDRVNAALPAPRIAVVIVWCEVRHRYASRPRHHRHGHGGCRD
jgi:hypothetical protein